MPTEDELKEAAKDGRGARRENMPVDACPWQIGTACHRYWTWAWHLEDRRQARAAVLAVNPMMSEILSAHGMVPARAAE